MDQEFIAGEMVGFAADLCPEPGNGARQMSNGAVGSHRMSLDE